MSTIPVKSLATTIRVSDIWCRRRDQDGIVTSQILFPSAALQLWDHHLHVSGLISPRRVFSSFSFQTTPVIYEQDWVCSYESVTCFPQEGLMELTVEDAGSAQSHVWVDRLGASTIYLGQLITLYDQVLATAVRILTRKEPTATTPSPAFQRPVSVPFTDSEREYFETSCAADDIFFDYQSQVLEKYGGEEGQGKAAADAAAAAGGDGPKIDHLPPRSEVDSPLNKQDAKTFEDNGKDNSDINGLTVSTPLMLSPSSPSNSVKQLRTAIKKRKLTLSSTLSLETFGTFLPMLRGKHLMTVTVGPRHLDYVKGGDGRFADTTWLADIAFQALVSAQPLVLLQSSAFPHSPATAAVAGGSCSLAVRYRSVAMLGNALHCILHGDRLYIVRAALVELGEMPGNEIVVLVAKAELL